MTSPGVYSLRMDPVKGGVSSALADIRSHWCDLAEHTSGKRITAVLADMTTAVRTRFSRGASSEAFAANGGGAFYPVEIRSEDLAVGSASFRQRCSRFSQRRSGIARAQK